jgi:hypothetical protein
MGSHIVTTARGDSPYIGLPIFLSRAFRHSAVYIRNDRGIHSAADLAGRSIALPEFQQTAALWVRGFLREQYGVDTTSIRWRSGGERVAIAPPPGHDLAPLGMDPMAALETGAVDALIADTEALIREGDELIERGGAAADEPTLSIAGYARRAGGMLRSALTTRPLPASAASAALALPLGFPPASPLGKAPSVIAALSQFDAAAATSASAAVSGLAMALIVSALFLPGVTGPAAIGAVFVMQSTVGGTGRRGLLRLLGTIIGGVMSAVALTIFASGVQDFGAYLCIMGVMAFMSAWVFVGSPRSNYAGLMMAAAWIIVIASDQQTPASLSPAVERVFSVIIAGLCVTFTIWMFATTEARTATMASIGSGWRQIAELLRRAQMLPFTDADLQFDDQIGTAVATFGDLIAAANSGGLYAVATFNNPPNNNILFLVVQVIPEQ